MPQNLTIEEFKTAMEKLAHVPPAISAEFKKNLISEEDLDAVIQAFDGREKFTPENLIERTQGLVSPGLTERLTNLSFEAKQILINSSCFRAVYLMSQTAQ